MSVSPAKYTFKIIATAVLLLVAASAVPWSDITGNKIKDFCLLSELFPQNDPAPASAASPVIDPELEELMAAANDATAAGNIAAPTPGNGADSTDSDTVAWIPPAAEAPKIDGHVVVETYTGRQPLERFRQALAQAGERVVRIGVLGDSFIEGDIFTQNLRAMLQQQYGGAGVGYVCMQSAMPGFRQSVRQSGRGWEVYNILNMPRRDSIRYITGEYAVSSPGAYSEYRGTGQCATSGTWYNSTAIVIARDSCTVTMTVDGVAPRVFGLSPSAQPQRLELAGQTGKLKVEVLDSSLIGLGVYLDGTNGIALDCMSSRGSAGLNLRKLNASNCAAVDYDLIIVEYGINALSADQNDYGYYRIGMTAALNRLKDMYPEADILMLGIADRGAKINGSVKSLPTCNAMTDAQRRAAQAAGVHFYDLRAAQGGENSIVEWRERQLVNADYIHLNHRGGHVLAEEFMTGLNLSLQSQGATAVQ